VRKVHVCKPEFGRDDANGSWALAPEWREASSKRSAKDPTRIDSSAAGEVPDPPPAGSYRSARPGHGPGCTGTTAQPSARCGVSRPIPGTGRSFNKITGSATLSSLAGRSSRPLAP
jgi:hypothetical protein